MRNSTILLAALTTVVGFQSVFQPARADDASLTVMPDKCVALRKGQVCYQKLRLRFDVPEKGDFCVFAQNQKEPLQCFINVSGGEFIYRFASDSAMEFSLMNAESALVAKGQVTLAWVYKRSRKRNRWRLF